MGVATLLLIASAIGGTDVLYYHLHRFRLATRPASRLETFAHLMQSGTFLAICSGVLVFPERRAVLLTLFVAHFASIGADVLVERASRLDLGGVPTAESLLHVVGSALTGAAVVATSGGGTPPMAGWQRAGLVSVVACGAIVAAIEATLLASGSRSVAKRGVDPKSGTEANGARSLKENRGHILGAES